MGDGTKMNRASYEQLIAEDVAWLLAQPRTLERDHIETVLRASPGREYDRGGCTGVLVHDEFTSCPVHDR